MPDFYREALDNFFQTAELSRTIRGFEQEVMSLLMDQMRIVVYNLTAMGCHADLQILSVTPPVVNQDEISVRVQGAARKVLLDSGLVAEYRTMGSEDMAFVLEKAPGRYFFVGSGAFGRGTVYGHHHPKFDIDKVVMPRTAGLMAAAVYDLLTDGFSQADLSGLR